jgi:Flp pilus assembly protein CpaB
MKTALFAHLIKFRRVIAAGSAGLAALLMFSALIGGSSGQTAVVIAARDISAGTQLLADDLAESTISTEVPWKGLFATKRQVTGRTTSHAIAAGQPLGASDIVSKDLLTGLKPGTVALEIAAAQVTNISMLEAGNHIDLYVGGRSSGGNAKLLAHDVLVVAKGSHSSQGFNGSEQSPLTMGSISQTAPLLIAVTATEAKEVAASLHGEPLTAVLLRK